MTVQFELKRGDRPAEIVDVLNRMKETASRHRIRCPTCGWQPGAASRWICTPTDAPEYYPHGCGNAWNTFETRGRCPGCDHAWRWTACLVCGMWARHEDWYAPEEDDDP